jgi:alpha-L-rhamnosidase
MFRHLAGIDLLDNGFRKVVIRPEPNKAIGPVSATYHSINGTIGSSWSLEGDNLKLEVTIPANTTAAVWIPALSPDQVTEGNLPLSQVEGLFKQERSGQYLILEIGSGEYTFSSAGAASLLADVEAP